MRRLARASCNWRRSPILQRDRWSFGNLYSGAIGHMTQEAQQQNSSQRADTQFASMLVPDDPPPGSEIPPQCVLIYDAMEEAGDKVDSAIARLQGLMADYADCILGSGKKADPWPPPAPGGEYVNVSGAPAAPVSVKSYKRQQIDETIGLIAGARRRLKDLLRTQ